MDRRDDHALISAAGAPSSRLPLSPNDDRASASDAYAWPADRGTRARSSSWGTRAAKGTRRNRRAPGLLDPVEVFGRSELVLRDALQGLNVDQLKDIVSEHAMDSAKLALKWRSADRLIELIVTTVRSRIEKGDAFKRDFVGQDTGR